MDFSTRNAFYLRVSNYRVIPLFLYLDERHVDWMSDSVLQQVIRDLQPKMAELLFSARYQKKHKVEVARGEGYQYCFFLRTTTRTEVTLLKQKSYSLRAPTPPPVSVPDTPPKRLPSRSRTIKTPQSASRPPRRSRSVTGASIGPGFSPPLMEVDDSSFPDDDVQVKDEPSGRSPDRESLEQEVNIKDWKPDVNVTFKGFGTSSVQLVLIIEPYPPLPASEYAPPSSRLSSRSTSIVSSYSRARTKGTGRYSSTSLSVALGGNERSQTVTPARNMRNPTRSVSAIPNSRRGGDGTPFSSSGREGSVAAGQGSRRRASQTPLFMARDTPFGDDEEDEEEHEAYEAALREGRMRLPSVTRPAGPELSAKGKGKRSSSRDLEIEEDDVPEGMMEIGERLVRSSEIEEGVVRVQGGWEERGEGEESAVMGREEPGD